MGIIPNLTQKNLVRQATLRSYFGGYTGVGKRNQLYNVYLIYQPEVLREVLVFYNLNL